MSKIIISLIGTGTDGSGKSTLATKVFQKIRENDKHIKKIYGRYTPIIVKLAMALGRGLFLKENKDMFSDYDNYFKAKNPCLERHQYCLSYI
jgi:thymidylate kinase